MHRSTFVTAILLLVALPAASAGAQVVLAVFPDPGPVEQPLRLTITNGMRSSIQLPNTAPWSIHDGSGNLVFAPMSLPVLVPVAPLASKQWPWDQKDLNQQPVKAGAYEARISYWLGGNKYELRTKFRIDGVTLVVRGAPSPGARIQLDLTAPASPSRFYQIACALGDTPGIPLPDNRLLALNPDALFFLSILNPKPVFDDFSGVLSRSGTGRGYVNIPGDGALVGVRFFAAFAALDPNSPGGIDAHSAARAITIR